MAVILGMGIGQSWADTAPPAPAPTVISAISSPTGSPTAVPETRTMPPMPSLSKAVAATPTPADDFHLTGRLGFGTGMVPFNENVYGELLNTISARYWFSEKFCLDLEGSYNGYSDSGTDFNDNTIQTPNETYAIGLGFKYNLKEPVKYLFLQLIGQISFADNSYENAQVYQLVTTNNETWGGFVGLGFEYFIPFFNSISVESNIGYSFDINDVITQTQDNPDAYGPTPVTTTSVVTRQGLIQVNGMTASSLIVHFYF